MMTLWYGPGTVALAVHIALEEIGAAYELSRLSFPDGEQTSPEYLAVNPKGRVPALRMPGGVLTETLAILSWLGETHPEANLMPSDPFLRARGLALQTYLASTAHVNHAHKLRGARWSDDPAAWDSMRAKVPETMTQVAVYLEAELGAGPWALGEAYSTSDPYLYTVCRWLTADGVDMARFPGLVAHHARMEDRPAVQRALVHH